MIDRKHELRKSLRAIVSAVDPADLARNSASICRVIASTDAARGARAIMLYAPMAGEVDVRALAHLLADATICVPRTDWHTNQLVPVEVTDFQQDLEPDPDAPGKRLLRPRATLAKIDPAMLELVIVPGLGFDSGGGRIGRGAGFYDRFLGSLPKRCVTIGAACSRQIIEQVPMEEHDARMKFVATENGLIECSAATEDDRQ